MSEAADSLLRAQLAVAARGGDDGDWADVLRRARRARRRRSLAAAGIAALVVAGVASALALTHPVVDFGSAEKGPRDVVVDFGRQNVLAPSGMKPGTLPEEARRITSVTIGGRAQVLYVAPTKSGGFCWVWSPWGGSCRAGRELPDRILWGTSASRTFTAMDGTFLFAAGSRLVAQYSDGSEIDVPFVWVTEPISAGFFDFETHERPGHEIVSLTLSDDAGVVLATEKVPQLPDGILGRPHRLPGFGVVNPSPQAIWAKRQLLFDVPIDTHRRAGLWIAPSTDGGTCWFSTRGSGCDNAGKPWRLSPALARKHPELKLEGPLIGLAVEGGSAPTLCCQVGASTTRVDLRYQDGTRKAVTPKRGYLLVVLAPEHYPLGHRLKELIAYDAAGNVVGRRRLDPAQMRGVYPCEHERNYCDRVTMCP